MDDNDLLRRIREAIEDTEGIERVKGRWPRESDCGGCAGLGSHRRNCSKSPDYNRWAHLADRAEGLGDEIGGTDPGLANVAYRLAGLLRGRAGGVVAG